MGATWGDGNHPVFGMKFPPKFVPALRAYSGISVPRHSGDFHHPTSNLFLSASAPDQSRSLRPHALGTSQRRSESVSLPCTVLDSQFRIRKDLDSTIQTTRLRDKKKIIETIFPLIQNQKFMDSCLLVDTFFKPWQSGSAFPRRGSIIVAPARPVRNFPVGDELSPFPRCDNSSPTGKIRDGAPGATIIQPIRGKSRGTTGFVVFLGIIAMPAGGRLPSLLGLARHSRHVLEEETAEPIFVPYNLFSFLKTLFLHLNTLVAVRLRIKQQPYYLILKFFALNPDISFDHEK